MVRRFPLPSLLCLLSFLEGDDVGEPYEQHDLMLPISDTMLGNNIIKKLGVFRGGLGANNGPLS